MDLLSTCYNASLKSYKGLYDHTPSTSELLKFTTVVMRAYFSCHNKMFPQRYVQNRDFHRPLAFTRQPM